MVKTPWFEEAIPFHQAAEIGTGKVISEHSTLGLVVTADDHSVIFPVKILWTRRPGQFTELKKQGKPFLILVNSQKPYKDETQKLTKELSEKYWSFSLWP